ncbi:MAG: hypothetical protein WA136_08805 [Rhodoferax sp.]
MNTPPPKPPFTTRRGFIFGAGFGVLALYGVWAANGAAPLSLLGGPTTQPAASGGHSEHGDASGGMSPAEFRRLTEAFIAANVLPDGSVRPQAAAPMMDMAAPPITPPVATNAHAGHGTPAPVSAHAGHDMAAMPAAEPAPKPASTTAPHDAAPPVDVYLLAHQWGYLPAVLRLQTGVRYRFRMMAEDVAHGASLQLGAASHIVRLRARTLVEQEVQFTSPGEHLLYCTVYCGVAHDRMQGRIIVSSASQGEQP